MTILELKKVVFMKEINNFSCICGADWAKLNYTRPVGELLAFKDNINFGVGSTEEEQARGNKFLVKFN